MKASLLLITAMLAVGCAYPDYHHPLAGVSGRELLRLSIENAVRFEAKKPNGELTETDYQKVKNFGFYGIRDGGFFGKGPGRGALRTWTSDLTPLQKLTGLEWLTFEDSRVSDLTPLSRLKELKTLELSGNLISDLSPLAGLPELKSLDIDNNRVTDLTPLKGLKNLQSLTLRHRGKRMDPKNPINIEDNPDLLDSEIAELKKALPNLTIVQVSTYFNPLP